MRKTWSVVVALLVVGLILSFAGSGFTQAPPPARHPHIRAAMRDLRQAANQLGQAAHDYGGHRAKALQLVEQAEGELRAALEWAQAHPGAPATRR